MSKQAGSLTMPLSQEQMSLLEVEEEMDMVLSVGYRHCKVRTEHKVQSGNGHAHWKGNPLQTEHEKSPR